MHSNFATCLGKTLSTAMIQWDANDDSSDFGLVYLISILMLIPMSMMHGVPLPYVVLYANASIGLGILTLNRQYNYGLKKILAFDFWFLNEFIVNSMQHWATLKNRHKTVQWALRINLSTGTYNDRRDSGG